MASLYDANTNYQINGVDLRDNPGLVTREYLIDVYPSLIDNFRFAGLWGWGQGTSGKLGTNDVASRSSPVQTVAGGTNWKQVNGGTYSSAAIKTDGTLWTWGGNSSPVAGILGDNTVVAKSSPIQTIAGGTNWKQVSVGERAMAAIKTDGTLWLWGAGDGGQLGNNAITGRSSPVQTIAGGTNWKQVSCAEGGTFTAAIKTDATLWTWGTSNSGQLGLNDIVNRSSPVQVGAGTDWKQVSNYATFTAAIKTDGTLWTWGANGNAQLGQNDTAARSSPTQVGAGTDWKQVSGGYFFMSAIKTDGTLWTWGYNSEGSLGLNDTVHRSSPVQVGTNTNWKQVGNGRLSRAIKTDGTLWTWGYNVNGELGTNDIANKSSPIQTISGGTNWKQVSGGYYSTLAIRDDSSDML